MQAHRKFSTRDDRELFFLLGGSEIYHEYPTVVIDGRGEVSLGSTFTGPGTFRGVVSSPLLQVCNGNAYFDLSEYAEELKNDTGGSYLHQLATTDGWQLIK